MNESLHIDYLRLRVRWIRNMKKHASFAVDRIRFPYTLIWLVLDGKLQIEINGERQWVARGDLVICPPHSQFALIPRDSDEPIHYLSLCADIKMGNFDLVSLYGLPTISHLVPSDDLTAWIRDWHSLVDSFNQFGDLVNSKTTHDKNSSNQAFVHHTDVSIQYLGLQGLIYQWMCQWLDQLRSRLPETPIQLDQRVMEVCDYVQDNLDKQLRLPMLAEQAHISTSQLCFLFKETLGMAPMEYVRRTRMEHAKQMLMSTSFTLNEIAEKIGYHDQSQFSRAFRQSEGTSPSQYRKELSTSSI